MIKKKWFNQNWEEGKSQNHIKVEQKIDNKISLDLINHIKWKVKYKLTIIRKLSFKL